MKGLRLWVDPERDHLRWAFAGFHEHFQRSAGFDDWRPRS